MARIRSRTPLIYVSFLFETLSHQTHSNTLNTFNSLSDVRGEMVELIQFLTSLCIYSVDRFSPHVIASEYRLGQFLSEYQLF